MKKLDYFLLAGLVALLLFSLGISQMLVRRQAAGELRLEIFQDGRLGETRNLAGNTTEYLKVFDEAGSYNLVEIERDRVRVAEADCANQVCVHTGWISQPGQVVVCAPHKLVLLIKGRSGATDAITY